MKTPEQWMNAISVTSNPIAVRVDQQWIGAIQSDAREGMVPFDMPKLMPTTAQLVLDFAKALADKLAAAEVKYGYGDSWATPDAEDWPHPKCFTDLVKHLQKGDPRDVAIYCAFLWYHGLSTSKCIEMAGMVPAAELQAVEKERDRYKAALENLSVLGTNQTARHKNRMSTKLSEYLERNLALTQSESTEIAVEILNLLDFEPATLERFKELERDNGLLKEQIRVADVAYQSLHERRQALIAEKGALQARLDSIELEEVRRIKHLNRLGTWAQQDPTGPIQEHGIREWVLNELKAALGSAYKPTAWQPESASDLQAQEQLEKMTADRDALNADCAAMLHVLNQFEWEDAIPVRFPAMVDWEQATSSDAGRELLERLQAVECVIKDLPSLFSDLSQLLDGWINHGDWTDWDMSVRGRLARAAVAVDNLVNRKG